MARPRSRASQTLGPTGIPSRDWLCPTKTWGIDIQPRKLARSCEPPLGLLCGPFKQQFRNQSTPHRCQSPSRRSRRQLDGCDTVFVDNDYCQPDIQGIFGRFLTVAAPERILPSTRGPSLAARSTPDLSLFMEHRVVIGTSSATRSFGSVPATDRHLLQLRRFCVSGQPAHTATEHSAQLLFFSPLAAR